MLPPASVESFIPCCGLALTVFCFQKSRSHGWNHLVIINALGAIACCIGVNICLLFTCWGVGSVSPKLRRHLNSCISQKLFIQAMSYILPPLEFVMTGDVPEATTQSIIIANHQVDADWWFQWNFMRAFDQHGDVKIILKDDFRNIPVLGWGLKGLNFVELRRDWVKDKEDLTRQLHTYATDKAPLHLMIYPEGTTMNTRSMEKGNQFAIKEGRPQYKHVLLPRTTGFNACLSLLHKDAPDGAVYDMTIAYEGYSGEIPTWEMGYNREKDCNIPSVLKQFSGQKGAVCHIHVVRYSMEEALSGGEKWLDSLWEDKDKLMSEFIKEGRFPGEPQRKLSVRPSPASFFLTAVALPLCAVWSVRCAAAGMLRSV